MNLELAEEAAHFKVETQVFSAQEVQAMEPDVEVNVRGGILYPSDCHMHPGDFMATLKKHLEQARCEVAIEHSGNRFEKNGSTVTAGLLPIKENSPVRNWYWLIGSWLPLTAKLLVWTCCCRRAKDTALPTRTYPVTSPSFHPRRRPRSYDPNGQ